MNLRGVLSWLLIAGTAACGGRSLSFDADLPGTSPAGNAGRTSINLGGAGGAAASRDDGAAAAATAAGAVSSSTTDRLISSGNQKLIDVFAGTVEVYVVLANAIIAFDRDGKLLQRVETPLEITTAAFDGERLAIADRDKLTIYALDLHPVSSAQTVEACASLVLLSKHRAICGSAHDVSHVFYTYDAWNGALLASSSPYTYNGIPMRRVPGTDDFVTTPTELSVPNYHLYRLHETAEVELIAEASYRVGLSANYGFNNPPATHLISDQGVLLKLDGEHCTAQNDSLISDCFVEDGSLGTLAAGQRFAALDPNDFTQVYALVDTAPNVDPSDDAPIRNFLIQSIDFPSRTVTQQTPLSLQLGKLVAFRRDEPGGRVLIGFRKGPLYHTASHRYPGYEVRSIQF